MADRRQIVVYSAGCAVCDDAVKLVSQLACDSCEVTIRDMSDSAVAREAAALGIRTVPAIVIDGRLADCCGGSGPNAETLRSLGIGTPLP